MSLTDDANLVVECVPSRVSHISGAVVPDHVFEAALRLATAYIEAGRVECGGCQFCGATETSEVSMECGTWWDVFDDCVRSEQCRDRQIANLTARLATVSAERDEHTRRLLEQSATLNAVRQERDHALLVVADLLDGADEHWQKTPRGGVRDGGWQGVVCRTKGWLRMSETRKYFEHITGKSERVLPTEPGWWWAKAGDAIAVLEVHRNRNGELCVSDPEHKEWRVDNFAFTWLEPVATLGTAARLAAAEAELAELKQRIAAAPVAWCLERWDGQMCALTKERSPQSVAWPTRKQVLLLEVGDWE